MRTVLLWRIRRSCRDQHADGVGGCTFRAVSSRPQLESFRPMTSPISFRRRLPSLVDEPHIPSPSHDLAPHPPPPPVRDGKTKNITLTVFAAQETPTTVLGGKRVASQRRLPIPKRNRAPARQTDRPPFFISPTYIIPKPTPPTSPVSKKPSLVPRKIFSPPPTNPAGVLTASTSASTSPSPPHPCPPWPWPCP